MNVEGAQIKKQSYRAKRNKQKEFKRNLPKLNIVSVVERRICEDKICQQNDKQANKDEFNYKKFQYISEYKDKNVEKGFQECFQVKKSIGQGAHSVVFKCIEKETQKVYSVKKTKQYDEELIPSIRQCYQIMKQLNHQYILKGKNLFINEKKMVSNLVCEYCDYPNLRNFIMKFQMEKKLVPKKIAAEIINKLIQVLVYLSEKNVCHRDIKPENILFDPLTQQIKLIDFQLAKMRRYKHEKLELWTETGTIDYRAPQYSTKAYGESVDTWAVGVIAYQLLTGSCPFTANSINMKKKQILYQKLNFQELPIQGQAKDFIKKMLQKNPEERITPKQALSHPFLLKNTVSRTSLKNLNITFDSDGIEDEYIEQKAKYYDEDTKFCFPRTLSDDIGVRFQIN